MKNTKRRGQVSLLVIQDTRTKKYLGICYELAIVLENDDEKALLDDLRQAAREYVDTVKNNSLPNYLLNKSDLLPKEYRELYDEFRSRLLLNKSTTKLSNDYEDALENGRVQMALACA